MATSSTTIEYLLDQLRCGPKVQVKKMFGEYCLYVDSKPVALVCHDTLFLKPTAAASALSLHCEMVAPYSGAKLDDAFGANIFENPMLLGKLLTQTAAALPVPEPKKLKSSHHWNTMRRAVFDPTFFCCTLRIVSSATLDKIAL